jgi:hypothetical protein
VVASQLLIPIAERAVVCGRTSAAETFVMRCGQNSKAFVELELAISPVEILLKVRAYAQTRRRLEAGSGQETFLPELPSPFSDLHC